jgi:hypothetical protein
MMERTLSRRLSPTQVTEAAPEILDLFPQDFDTVQFVPTKKPCLQVPTYALMVAEIA